jgi:hypothetical protein
MDGWRMVSFQCLPISLLVILASGCQTHPRIVDQRPEFIPREQLSSVRSIVLEPHEGSISMATAIVVGENHLLTNAHVWSREEDWLGGGLEEEQEVMMLDRDRTSDLELVLSDAGRTTLRVPSSFVGSSFRLVESGLLDRAEGRGGSAAGGVAEQVLNDWVLIETETPIWGPQDVAVIHPPAMSLGWVVPKDTQLYVPGFSSIFRDDSFVLERDQASFLASGPYTLSGAATMIDGAHFLGYPVDWPAPLGHSGAGVYLWNDETKQLELIGIFSLQLPVDIENTVVITPLGISALSFPWTLEEEGQRLGYTQISRIVPALQGAGVLPLEPAVDLPGSE